MVRLFRKGSGEYEDLGMRGQGGWDTEIHENLVVSGRTRCLRAWLLHESRQDLAYWIQKQNVFSDWNAARRLGQLEEPIPPLADLVCLDPLRRRKWLKALFIRLPAKPILLFMYLYVVKLGFLDGRAGLYFCALRAAHELNTVAKLYELQHEAGTNAARRGEEA